VAIDYPNSPTNGQQFTPPGGVLQQWDGAKWVVVGGGAGGGGAVISDTAPTSPTSGELWWDSTDAQLYVSYTDPNSTQWVAASTFAGDLLAQSMAMHNVGRNLLHNPLFNVQQRGAGPWTLTNLYTADRWAQVLAGPDTTSATIAHLSDTDRSTIGDEAARYCLSNLVGGSATGHIYVFQSIEQLARLAGKIVTVSFYANASAALKVGVNLVQNFGTGGSPSASAWVSPTGQAVTLLAGAAWARYTATFTIPSIQGKTIGTNGNDSTQLAFWLSAGDATAPLAGNIGMQSGTINLWGVQLEVGSVATPLEKPDPQQDLARCQRFFIPRQCIFSNYASVNGIAASVTDSLPVTMRATPTITPTGNSNNNTSAVTFTALNTTAGVVLQIITSAIGTWSVNQSYTASADL
jgi:hypothetical protein